MFCSVFPCCVFWLSVPAGVPVVVWSLLGFTWVPWPVWFASCPVVGLLFWSGLGFTSVSWFGADPGLTVAPNWPLWLGLEPSCPVLPCSAFWSPVAPWVPVAVWSVLGLTSASWLGVVPGLTVAPAWSVVPGADGSAFWLFCSVLPCSAFWLPVAPWVPVAVWSLLGFTWVPWPVWFPSWPLVGVLFWSGLGLTSASWLGVVLGLTVAPAWSVVPGADGWAFWLFCSVLPCCVFWLSVPAGVPVAVWSVLGFTCVSWLVFPGAVVPGSVAVGLFSSGFGDTSPGLLAPLISSLPCPGVTVALGCPVCSPLVFGVPVTAGSLLGFNWVPSLGVFSVLPVWPLGFWFPVSLVVAVVPWLLVGLICVPWSSALFGSPVGVESPDGFTCPACVAVVPPVCGEGWAWFSSALLGAGAVSALAPSGFVAAGLPPACSPVVTAGWPSVLWVPASAWGVSWPWLEASLPGWATEVPWGPLNCAASWPVVDVAGLPPFCSPLVPAEVTAVSWLWFSPPACGVFSAPGVPAPTWGALFSWLAGCVTAAFWSPAWFSFGASWPVTPGWLAVLCVSAPACGPSCPWSALAGCPPVSTVPVVTLSNSSACSAWACVCPKNKNDPTIIEAVPTVNFLIA